MIKTVVTKLLILTIILTAALSVNYLFAAWNGPTQAPPGGNAPAPIHVGSVNQVKDGGLSLNALSVFGNGWFQGGIQFGNTTNEVAGTVRWTGTDFEGYDGTQWVSLVSGEVAADPNYTACINVGGSWIATQSLCYIPGSGCPSGWSRKQSFGSTIPNTCSGGNTRCTATTCTTSFHTRKNQGVETCTYQDTTGGYPGCWQTKGYTCSASLSEVGCTKN